MGRQLRVAKRSEQRAHLRCRQLLACLDCGFARNGRGEMLVAGSGSRNPVASKRIQRLTQAPLGVESAMRHRNRAHDERVSTKPFDLEAKLLEILAVRFERVALRGPEMKRYRKKQSLRRRISAFKRVHEFLVQHALMSGMLVDEHESF